MSLPSAKITDQLTNDIINGYLKQHQSLLSYQSIPYYNIPPLINQLILSFYYTPEQFTSHGECIKLNEACDIAMMSTKQKDEYHMNSVYLDHKIGKNTYCNKFIWEFKIMNVMGSITVAIGLDTSDKLYTDAAFDDTGYNKSLFYSFECSTYDMNCFRQCQYRNNDDDKFSTVVEVYGSECWYVEENKDHIVKMEFDTKERILKYYVDGRDQGIAFDKKHIPLIMDCDIEYIAAISMDGEISLQLLSFQQMRD